MFVQAALVQFRSTRSEAPTFFVGFVMTFFLKLHTAVLEPYFDLFFGEIKVSGDFYPSESREVHIGVEFSLELQ